MSVKYKYQVPKKGKKWEKSKIKKVKKGEIKQIK